MMCAACGVLLLLSGSGSGKALTRRDGGCACAGKCVKNSAGGFTDTLA